jgi:hypothetical protein
MQSSSSRNRILPGLEEAPLADHGRYAGAGTMGSEGARSAAGCVPVREERKPILGAGSPCEREKKTCGLRALTSREGLHPLWGYMATKVTCLSGGNLRRT